MLIDNLETWQSYNKGVSLCLPSVQWHFVASINSVNSLIMLRASHDDEA